MLTKIRSSDMVFVFTRTTPPLVATARVESTQCRSLLNLALVYDCQPCIADSRSRNVDRGTKLELQEATRLRAYVRREK